ncbi:trafficking protein particle complex subunit 11 isoform X1 [Carya illinoinensis]|uniref:trafficking protein particle complex subunit 11 isoform X1 n=1 Tax=Carya illinoinensis TaxID=32201 RepID=UPI001C71C078|nr:trafficking protein particle complex subunit 11 isoform X1 [Carya illinoinensis]
MEEYPEELRTPPVSLVSLVGCPELHAAISKHLHSEQPPINTLALPDFSKVSLFSRTPKGDDPSPAHVVPGILKRDWLLKHRTRVPSVLAALFSSDQLSGDPAQWLQVCSLLDQIKAVLRSRNIKFLLVVVVPHGDDIGEDRMLALRKRAELDSKYVVILKPDEPSELKQSLSRLGSALAELANTYYRDEGKRVKLRIEKKTSSSSSIELHIRYCFKVAVYAEFRRDWAEALRFYEDAYHTLREMVGTSKRLPAIQRLVEIKTVAEQLHFKISTLLLHGGKVGEAVTWFRQHNGSYRRLVGTPEAVFLHWEWMSRQFLVFGELLDKSSAAITNISSLALGTADKPLSEWESRPAYYYQLAAHYLKEKRACLELALSMSETGNEMDNGAESVVPSAYVGQFARLLEQGDEFAMQSLTDEEYIRFAVVEGKRFQDSYEIIALLKKSYESYSNLKVQRMGSFCGFQIGKEYYMAGEFNNAKQLFDDIASLYRREGWVTLLWEVLGYLRECARKYGTVKELIEYSLEMAALPVSSGTDTQMKYRENGPAGPASLARREEIHKDVFGLVIGESGLSSVERNDDLKITLDNPLHLEIDLVSPLRLVLLASVAFHEQKIKPSAPTLITLSLLSQLPLTVEIDRLEVQFNQSNCNFIIMNAQRPPLAATADDKQGHRVETSSSLTLSTNKWLRLTYDVKSEYFMTDSDQSGKLECTSVIAKMGPYFTICCRAESPASMEDLPLFKFEDRVETSPTKDPALAFTGQKATQIEEPDPQVDLNLGASGPALVGERFIVPVTVSSVGHAVYSGELKINLVDVRGGSLFSPRETEAYSLDSHHVELVGISVPEGKDETQLDTDEINKIQKSFGLFSVPFLKCGESWSCKLEIKWHRPKPVMLYVSLGYSPYSFESTAQKVNVHKSLQIEGKTAIVISHRFLLPFRQDPLLLSRIKAVADSDLPASLPRNETCILLVSAKNSAEVPLKLLGMTLQEDNEDTGRPCSVRHEGEDLLEPALLVPGEEFKKVFTVISEDDSSKLTIGTACVTWTRDSGSKAASVLTKQTLPDVNVESPPLVVSLDCPPYAILGDPFTYLVKIRNQTQLLQEVKFSLADAQSFVLSGSHNDTVFVLPKSEHILSYKLVPLASGVQQMPRFTVTAVRYSAGFQPSIAASTIFIFPSKPHFKGADVGTGG